MKTKKPLLIVLFAIMSSLLLASCMPKSEGDSSKTQSGSTQDKPITQCVTKSTVTTTKPTTPTVKVTLPVSLPSWQATKPGDSSEPTRATILVPEPITKPIIDD